ncbi:MAG: alpha/beta fold hydrolase [Aestuariibacter sp.]
MLTISETLKLAALPFKLIIAILLLSPLSTLACNDAVVLVHGNSASPSSWQNTYNELLSRGYSASEIYQPNWGSKWCAACNNHYGSEETPVRSAISSALANSCTGKIDVVAHSMGVTLAAQQIDKLGVFNSVDSFVGVAGAWRGLWSCGVYPFNVPNSTCGYYGLSVQSPFLDSLYNVPIANRVFTIKSYMDQVVCSTGVCTVGGVHSSRIPDEQQSYTYTLGHFGLQTDTYELQVDLIQ